MKYERLFTILCLALVVSSCSSSKSGTEIYQEWRDQFDPGEFMGEIPRDIRQLALTKCPRGAEYNVVIVQGSNDTNPFITKFRTQLYAVNQSNPKDSNRFKCVYIGHSDALRTSEPNCDTGNLSMTSEDRSKYTTLNKNVVYDGEKCTFSAHAETKREY